MDLTDIVDGLKNSFRDIVNGFKESKITWKKVVFITGFFIVILFYAFGKNLLEWLSSII